MKMWLERFWRTSEPKGGILGKGVLAFWVVVWSGTSLIAEHQKPYLQQSVSPKEAANRLVSTRVSSPALPGDDSDSKADSLETNSLTHRVPPSKVGRGVELRKLSTDAIKFDPRQGQAAILTNFSTPTVTNSLPPEWLLPPTDPFVIGPGDTLEVELLGAGERSPVLVCPDGKIYYGLLPGIDVWGLTLNQMKEVMERELFKFQRIPRPKVAISIRAVGSKHIWMLGRVNAPGLYPLPVPVSLLEAITEAGGPVMSGDTDLASLQDSFVMRQGQLLPVDFRRLLRLGDLSQNIYLQADDFVYLPSSFHQQVHVLGAVRQPGPIPYHEESTLLSAIASVGGLRGEAYLSHVAIVRGSLNDPKIAVVDFSAIQKGKATDVLLEPRDIVFVPNSPYVLLVSYIKTIVMSFIRTVAVNEGVRAVIRSTDVVRPTLPVP